MMMRFAPVGSYMRGRVFPGRVFPERAFPKQGFQYSQFSIKKGVNIATDTTILGLIQCKKGPKKRAILEFIQLAVGGQHQSKEADTYGRIHNRWPLVSLSHFEICKSNLISLCLYQYDSLLNYVVRTRNKHHLTVIQIQEK